VFDARTGIAFDGKQRGHQCRAVFLGRDIYALELDEALRDPGVFFGTDTLEAVDAERAEAR
jgi:hypothetical protein